MQWRRVFKHVLTSPVSPTLRYKQPHFGPWWRHKLNGKKTQKQNDKKKGKGLCSPLKGPLPSFLLCNILISQFKNWRLGSCCFNEPFCALSIFFRVWLAPTKTPHRTPCSASQLPFLTLALTLHEDFLKQNNRWAYAVTLRFRVGRPGGPEGPGGPCWLYVLPPKMRLDSQRRWWTSPDPARVGSQWPRFGEKKQRICICLVISFKKSDGSVWQKCSSKY